MLDLDQSLSDLLLEGWRKFILAAVGGDSSERWVGRSHEATICGQICRSNCRENKGVACASAACWASRLMLGFFPSLGLSVTIVHGLGPGEES